MPQDVRANVLRFSAEPAIAADRRDIVRLDAPIGRYGAGTV